MNDIYQILPDKWTICLQNKTKSGRHAIKEKFETCIFTGILFHKGGAIPHSSQLMIQNILSNDSPLKEHSANLSYPWVGHQVLPACALKFVGHIHAVVLGVATDRSIPSTFLLNALEYLATLEESLLANLKSKKYCFTNRN